MKLWLIRIGAAALVTAFGSFLCDGADALVRERAGVRDLAAPDSLDAAGRIPRRLLAALNGEGRSEGMTEARQLNDLALLYQHQGRYTDAEPLYQRSLAMLEDTLGPNHPAVAASLGNLAALYQEEGRYADAERLCRRSVDILEKALGPEHPAVAESLRNLADLYQAQGRAAEADALQRQSEAIRRITHGSAKTCNDCR